MIFYNVDIDRQTRKVNSNDRERKLIGYGEYNTFV